MLIVHKTVTKPTAILLALLLFWCAPAQAISIKEERELSQEFMRYVNRYYEMVEDPVIIAYVNAVGKKILAKLPVQPFEYRFFVIKENVYNAFAIPAGHIFINSGLLLAMDDEDELAGILAHEISHVVCRHISQRIDRSKKIDLATLAGVVAGVFLGVAGGSPEAAQALTLGSMAANQTLQLSYSRDDERQADQFGLDYLEQAGYSAEGLLVILKKIRGRQWFGTDQIPTYMMTHPAVEERIAYIDAWLSSRSEQGRKNLRGGNHPEPFVRMQNRLRALYGDPKSAADFFESGLKKNPTDPELSHGYGLLLARRGNRREAVDYLQQALTRDAMDPVVLSDLGRLQFLGGNMKDALKILQGAASLPGINPEGLYYLGRTYMELGDLEAAADTFEDLIEKDETYAASYLALGETYGKLDRIPEAHYFLGLYHYRKGDDRTAHYHLMRAEKGLKDPKRLEEVRRILKESGKALPQNEE
jgi:predicted Zn-dependent protease